MGAAWLQCAIHPRLIEMKLIHAYLAEFVVLENRVVKETRNIIRGHFGARELPWTTTVAFVLVVTGFEGECVPIRCEVAEAGRLDAPLYWRNLEATIVKAGEQAVPVSMGPLVFSSPGRYVFSASAGDASISTTADLTAASAQ
jgi:hypothetical protein